MEKLVKLFNEIDEALSKAKLDDKIELPRTVVIGSQSAGKSSVLESIAGFDFLPRGTGLVTRCPLVMQCVRSIVEEPVVEFTHRPGHKYKDFKEVRKEIESRTEELAGRGKKIVEDEIRLTITSKDVVNLTLIDLPGFIKNAGDDQDEDLPDIIRNFVEKYIKNEHTIILAITPATDDMANSEAIQFARKFDRNGDRTLGVLTKIDLMDRGTNALKLLTGQEYPLKHGYVAVKGRSQQDIKDGKTIKEAILEEKEFFYSNEDYSKIAEQQGIEFLGK